MAAIHPPSTPRSLGAAATLPTLALVPGEAAGIGPEITLALAARPLACALLAIADADHLEARAAQVGSPVLIERVAPGAPVPAHRPGVLCVQPVAAARPAIAGQPDPANVPALLEAFALAADGCLAGRFDAMVTGPVQKSTINAAGVAFSGVTELLARHAGGVDVVMMLATPELRVALATTHLPLRAVADALTPARLETTLRVLHRALQRDFGFAAPRIAVLGLNPHAGEDGHLGREEIEVIAPLLERLRSEGMQLEGPLPADTAFLPHRLAQVDAVLAMYHDQGLPVLKFSGFDRAVNITLGLPFLRIAVDHGTALDLAGTGRADPSSLVAATELAIRLAHRRMASR